MGFLLLLSHNNVKAVERNHPDEFIGALRAVEAIKAQTGLPFTVDEQRRLAALAVLQSKSLFSESSPKLLAQLSTTTKPKRRSRKAAPKEAMPV